MPFIEADITKWNSVGQYYDCRARRPDNTAFAPRFYPATMLYDTDDQVHFAPPHGIGLRIVGESNPDWPTRFKSGARLDNSGT
eukprot:gene6721-21515_t